MWEWAGAGGQSAALKRTRRRRLLELYVCVARVARQLIHVTVTARSTVGFGGSPSQHTRATTPPPHNLPYGYVESGTGNVINTVANRAHRRTVEPGRSETRSRKTKSASAAWRGAASGSAARTCHPQPHPTRTYGGHGHRTVVRSDEFRLFLIRSDESVCVPSGRCQLPWRHRMGSTFISSGQSCVYRSSYDLSAAWRCPGVVGSRPVDRTTSL